VRGTFTFSIPDGDPNSVDVKVGDCSCSIEVPAGAVSVIEKLDDPSSGIAVSGITAIGKDPSTGKPINELLSSSLDKGKASVNVAASKDDSIMTIVTFTNQKQVSTGIIEICKDEAPGAALSGLFSFTVSGVSSPVSVPIGACSGPIVVKAGAVTVTEVPQIGSQLVSVATIPSTRLVSSDIPSGSAVVSAPPSPDVSGATIVRFANGPTPSGQLKVCKAAVPGSGIDGQNFTIIAGGVSYLVPAGPPSMGGYCVLAGSFTVGTSVSITEPPSTANPPAYTLTNIGVNPPARRGPDLPNGVMATVGPGITEVTFTNKGAPPRPPGKLNICKIAGQGVTPGTMFSFTVSANGGPPSSPINVPAGDANSCTLDGSFTVGTQVTVAELPMSGYVVTCISTSPGGPCLPPGSGPYPTSATITIADGMNQVTFTNAVTQLTLPAFDLPCGLIGTPYSQTLQASGGLPPYTWALINGRLPFILTLDSTTGTISGTPTSIVPGSIVTFQVSDSSSPAQTASRASVMTISDSPMGCGIDP
jgi:hypothetical protein